MGLYSEYSLCKIVHVGLVGHYKVRKHASGACWHKPQFVGRKGKLFWGNKRVGKKEHYN